MIKTVRDAWQIPELRRKILFTIFALLIFRLGACSSSAWAPPFRCLISTPLVWRPI